MSLRSTMDMGLAALTAPSESLGSAVGVLAAVGAAAVGLAAVSAAQKAVAERVKTLPAFRLPRQTLYDAHELEGHHKGTGRWRRGWQSWLASDRVVERLVSDPIDAPSAERDRWRKALEDPESVPVLADALLERGDPLGEVLALRLACQPFVNMDLENEWSSPLNVEMGATSEEGNADWRETHCTLESPWALGDAGSEWFATVGRRSSPAVTAAMLDRFGYDGDKILETYGGRTFADFVPDDCETYYRWDDCLHTSVHTPDSAHPAAFEVLVYSKGPLPKKGE